MIEIGFVLSVFLAGIIMFLAPCTLPLVPAYLAFISGVPSDAVKRQGQNARRRIVINGTAFVLGFSLVFISLGVLLGLFGSYLGTYRAIIAQAGGAIIIVFGIMMLGVLRPSFLEREYKFRMPAFLTPGKPSSAFLIGASFAFGWTPCVGPILASVLLVASTSTEVLEGAVLLAVFSLGLAIPFLLTAYLYGYAERALKKMERITQYVSVVGGVFLIFLGILLLTNSFGLTIEYGYRIFDFLHYDALLKYL